MNRKITIIVLVLLAAGVIYALAAEKTSAKPEQVTVVAERGDVELLITAAGKLEPAAYVDVGAQVSGQLKRLPRREGDSVQKGEVLAEIDATLANAKLLEARATLDNLHAQETAQRAELTRAQQRAERYRGLLEQDAIAREEFETANSAYDSARAGLKALGAQIRQAEASVSTAEANLGYTAIRSPMSGVVVTTYAREGQTLNANQTAPLVLRVADLTTMTVVAQVSEADVSRLRVGQEAYFTVLGQPQRRWEGKLRQIKPAPEIISNVVFYHALFDVPNAGELMSQMTAQVFFVLDRARDAVRLPLGALRKRQGKQAEVQVLKEGDSEVRTVKLGLVGETEVAVESGLEAGETVILPQPAGRPGSARTRKTTMPGPPGFGP